MDLKTQFAKEVDGNIASLRKDADLQAMSRIWVREITRHKYAYNFQWMGRPIIQLPQDMIGMQELIWQIKPDLIIETGIAHGGSLIYYASLLELVGQPDAQVLGVDIDIRSHNRVEIETHSMSKRIKMIEGSAVDEKVFAQVKLQAAGKERILVVLDSNHTHQHVLEELRLYGSLVRKGSYIVVFDTVIEDMPDDILQSLNRPWGKGNNPKTAVYQFLSECDRFEIDKDMEAKLLITVAPDGWLRCTK